MTQIRTVQTILRPTVLATTATLVLFFITANTGQAQSVLEERLPVPTYGNINSFGESTSVEIPESLAKIWQKETVVSTQSMLTEPQRSTDTLIAKVILNLSLEESSSITYQHDAGAIYGWTKKITESVDTEPAEPVLVIEGNRAVEFTPPTIGKKIDRYQSTFKILEALEAGETNVELAVLTTHPSKNLASLNDLGITELIGRGESNFAGSPANRRHNIKIGAEKIKGVIVMPGEEFSFNDNLGPVEASEGFLPELVIKGNDTIPELGGGLCQVSSTTFRAIMHAGLPVTQRRNHSYAVQYYAPQGSDATIYPGVIDLKFSNDTENAILIWPYFTDADHLVFDFYGTDDGREVILNNPVTYDRQSNGALKATWTRTVIKDGEEQVDRFSSNYRPPAEFHRNSSEEFVSEDGSTTAADTRQVTPDPDIKFFVGSPPEEN